MMPGRSARAMVPGWWLVVGDTAQLLARLAQFEGMFSWSVPYYSRGGISAEGEATMSKFTGEQS